MLDEVARICATRAIKMIRTSLPEAADRFTVESTPDRARVIPASALFIRPSKPADREEWSESVAHMWAVAALSDAPVINRPRAGTSGLWYSCDELLYRLVSMGQVVPSGDFRWSSDNGFAGSCTVQPTQTVVVVRKRAWTIGRLIGTALDLEATSIRLLHRLRLDFAAVTWSYGPEQRLVGIDPYPALGTVDEVLPPVANAIVGALCGEL